MSQREARSPLTACPLDQSSLVNANSSPTDSELWAIEVEAELLTAQLATADAETAWYRRPDPETAADYLAAVTEMTDLHSFYGHDASGADVAPDSIQGVA